MTLPSAPTIALLVPIAQPALTPFAANAKAEQRFLPDVRWREAVMPYRLTPSTPSLNAIERFLPAFRTFLGYA